MKHYRWHRFVFWMLRVLVGPFLKRSMAYQCDKNKGPFSPAIIIGNHNTNLDPALVGLAFTRHMYYVSSEHALRKGLMSKALKFLFSPIAINKTHADSFTVKEMLRRLKAGHNVCVFAEGNRSYNGVTGPVPLSTAKLARHSGADLITYHIEGGYFTTPRWGAGKRKGKMVGHMVRHYSAAELKTMTDAQVLQAIEQDIFEDAYARQRENPIPFRGKNLAEHIETALYMCPKCKKIGSIRSEGDHFFCRCGLHATYTETGFLKGEALPFSTVTDWDHWQTEQLALIIDQSGDQPICGDEQHQLYEVRATGATLVGQGATQISRTAFDCAGLRFPLGQITRFAIADQMTLLFSLKDGTLYEIHSAIPCSMLKYREAFCILNLNT